jgi:hypothetical protein
VSAAHGVLQQPVQLPRWKLAQFPPPPAAAALATSAKPLRAAAHQQGRPHVHHWPQERPDPGDAQLTQRLLRLLSLHRGQCAERPLLAAAAAVVVLAEGVDAVAAVAAAGAAGVAGPRPCYVPSAVCQGVGLPYVVVGYVHRLVIAAVAVAAPQDPDFPRRNRPSC